MVLAIHNNNLKYTNEKPPSHLTKRPRQNWQVYESGKWFHDEICEHGWNTTENRRCKRTFWNSDMKIFSNPNLARMIFCLMLAKDGFDCHLPTSSISLTVIANFLLYFLAFSILLVEKFKCMKFTFTYLTITDKFFLRHNATLFSGTCWTTCFSSIPFLFFHYSFGYWDGQNM